MPEYSHENHSSSFTQQEDGVEVLYGQINPDTLKNGLYCHDTNCIHSLQFCNHHEQYNCAITVGWQIGFGSQTARQAFQGITLTQRNPFFVSIRCTPCCTGFRDKNLSAYSARYVTVL